MQIFLSLLLTLSVGAAQKKELDHGAEAEKVNGRGCSNLTVVLDNWKYAIMTQVKDLLLNDHSTVLPDYSRIGPLSGALTDLFRELNSLKQRLGELTAEFGGVETLVDDVRSGRRGECQSEVNLMEPSESDVRLRRRKKVKIRRVIKVKKPKL